MPPSGPAEPSETPALAPEVAALDHEARTLVTTFTSSAKGTAILKGVRKDFKLAPSEVVPAEATQLKAFIAALKEYQEKL
jgi:hypothetical protein